MERMTLQEALAMFPAEAGAPQMMVDAHGDLQCMQEAARVLADNIRRLLKEQLILLRGIRELQLGVVKGQDYCLVRTYNLNAMARTVADLYPSTPGGIHVQQPPSLRP